LEKPPIDFFSTGLSPFYFFTSILFTTKIFKINLLTLLKSKDYETVDYFITVMLPVLAGEHWTKFDKNGTPSGGGKHRSEKPTF
jgi:hypothetical protein